VRKALSLIAALAAALALLVVLELGLRLAGIGAAAHDSQLKYQQVFLPVMRPDVGSDGRAILRTSDPRLPYQQVPAEKDPRAQRVYFFGESAMAGLGFSPNVTIARQFERIAAPCLAPDRMLEVVNLGIVALPLKKVRLLVEDVIAHGAPDLLVVFVGNNEFLELHARKFALVGASPLQRLKARIADTSLYRLIRPPREVRPEELVDASAGLEANDARVSEDRMIQEVEVSQREIAEVHAQYEHHLQAIARAAHAASVPLVLMTPAVNWEWHGREDLAEDWPAEIVLGWTPDGDWLDVVAALNERLVQGTREQDYEWFYRRALARLALGDAKHACSDLREALTADPHLRRATDAMANHVRRVANREATILVDTVSALSGAAGKAKGGIVGYEFFYDYVHFTPRGAALAAGALVEKLAAEGLLPASCVERAEESARAHAEPAGPPPPDGLPDFLAVEDWRGLGLDPARARDRDLWKYNEALAELDARIAAEPGDWRALVYRGNAAFFRQDGAADAERDWMRALELGGDEQVIGRNLEILRAQARPTAD
jgi:tetratricopeptide (TPR) repeat protein